MDHDGRERWPDHARSARSAEARSGRTSTRLKQRPRHPARSTARVLPLLHRLSDEHCWRWRSGGNAGATHARDQGLGTATAPPLDLAPEPRTDSNCWATTARRPGSSVETFGIECRWNALTRDARCECHRQAAAPRITTAAARHSTMPSGSVGGRFDQDSLSAFAYNVRSDRGRAAAMHSHKIALGLDQTRSPGTFQSSLLSLETISTRVFQDGHDPVGFADVAALRRCVIWAATLSAADAAGPNARRSCADLVRERTELAVPRCGQTTSLLSRRNSAER